MTDFLVRIFVKNYKATDNAKVRADYGALSSITGIVCNVILFALKYFIGSISGSISVISDAFNNLSDSASCVVTLIGYKMAAKPADKDHPFGHGRAEYLTSLIIAVLIILVGFELLRSSALKIAEPDEVVFSIAAAAALIFSAGMKLWLSAFNSKLGKKINSAVMLATAQDSKNDVIATLAALIGLTASLFTDLPIDGIMGIAVSVFIIKAGYDIVRDTVDELLGKPADSVLVKQIREIVTSSPRIIGIHDLIVHNYGPGQMIASCHAEVRSCESLADAHELIDKIEREIHSRLGICITIHMDPVDTDDSRTNALRQMTKELVRSIDERLSIHDFRILTSESVTQLMFDIVVPYDCRLKDEEIKASIDEYLKEKDPECTALITFDKDFTE